MKYRFLEALDKIVGTERCIKYFEEGVHNPWHTYSNGCLRNSKSDELWWPSIETQQAKIWEVEPEEIYVWCHCDLNTHSWIYTRNIKGTGFSKTEYAQFPTSNLFSQELKKFKIVPVED